ncbi:MAG TPA: DUF4124 domain-containing protein [Rhodocyclaceae bacterium]
MKTVMPILFASLAALPAAAFADMYKCVDADGHVTYSNSSSKGCRKIVIQPAVSAPAPVARPAPAAREGFPRVDEATQRARDDMRRGILEDELEGEARALAEAREKLAEQETVIEPDERNVTQRCVPAASGGMNCSAVPGGINAGKREERLRPFRDKVAQHERNIESLNREISRLP